jgi:DNA-directed RNA polymerase specialized sigma24 family protein
MDDSTRFFGTRHPFANAEQEALYQSLGGFLQGLLVRQFQVPPEDAELLVCEAFHVYYEGKVPVPNEREWLFNAACGHAKNWLQSRGLLPANEEELARNAGTTFSHRVGREMLPERAQKALHLRFAEKKTYEQIAAELGVPQFLAQHIVTKAAANLRRLLRGGVRGNHDSPSPA